MGIIAKTVVRVFVDHHLIVSFGNSKHYVSVCKGTNQNNETCCIHTFCVQL